MEFTQRCITVLQFPMLRKARARGVARGLPGVWACKGQHPMASVGNARNCAEPRIGQELGREGCAEDDVHAGTSCPGKGEPVQQQEGPLPKARGPCVETGGGATSAPLPRRLASRGAACRHPARLGVDCARGWGGEGEGLETPAPKRGARVSSLP